MKRILTLIAALLITAPHALAIPAIRRPVVHTQSDGTQITIRIVGDEYRHYTLSSEGYTLVGGADGDLYYAALSQQGKLVSTNVKARPLARLTTAERATVSKLTKGVKPTAVSKMFANRTKMRAPQLAADGTLTAPGRISTAQTTGKLKSLVILVNFKDTKFKAANTRQSFQDMLMQDGYSVNGATGSAWNYYQDNSNKRFDPDFVVVGPYTVSKTSSYYAGPKDDPDNGVKYAGTMIVEAAKLADADGVDFTEYASDGTIRDIFVFYAGQNQAETGNTSTVWPHRWDVSYDTETPSNMNVYLDDQHLAGYACSGELRGSTGTMAGIGTFCHEFGHVLGWPDFYDTDYEKSGGQSASLSTFSLMDYGSYSNDGRTPPAVNILERWMMGWATPEDISTGGTHTLLPVWNDKGYLVRTPTTNDYFLLECRATGGFKWDNYIEDGNGTVNPAAKGLIVYHVDYTTPKKWIDDNALNANPSHECMKLVRSVPGSSSADKPLKTFFPGSSNVTTLSSTSNTDYKSWAKASPLTNFTSITLSGEQIILVSPGGGSGEVTPMAITSAAINQSDALLTWDNAASASWTVTWKTNGQQVGTKTVTTGRIVIDGLTPNTKYDLSFVSGSNEYSYSFTTKAPSGDNTVHIGIPSEIKAGEPFVLSILDSASSPKSTEWVIDGQKIAGSEATLSTGEHKIRATITDAGGNKQHIIKFVTAK